MKQGRVLSWHFGRRALEAGLLVHEASLRVSRAITVAAGYRRALVVSHTLSRPARLEAAQAARA